MIGVIGAGTSIIFVHKNGLNHEIHEKHEKK